MQTGESQQGYSAPQPPYGQIPQPTLLDRVLATLDTEQKARALDIVLRLDIQPDDPIFAIALCIGQLQILVEDAPDEWQQLFTDFKAELNAWTATNTQALTLVAEKGLLMQRLAETSMQLSDVLQSLVTACNTLGQRLNTSQANSHTLSTAVSTSSRQMQTGFDTLTSLVKHQHGQVSQSLSSLGSGLKTARRAARRSTILATLALAGVFFLGWQQHQTNQQMRTLTRQSERQQ